MWLWSIFKMGCYWIAGWKGVQGHGQRSEKDKYLRCHRLDGIAKRCLEFNALSHESHCVALWASHLQGLSQGKLKSATATRCSRSGVHVFQVVQTIQAEVPPGQICSEGLRI